MLLDEKSFELVQSGAASVTQITGTMQKQLLQLNSGSDITVTHNGYLYVWVSNESKGNVYFDDIRVEHQQGPLLEENHYYPYGLKMAALCSKAFGSLLNKFQYQGTFSEFDEETGYDEFALRDYDPQRGQWTGVDPKDQYSSPYVGMGSNPANRIDPDGGFDFTAPALGAFVGWSAGLTYGVLSGKHDPLKYGLIGAGIGVAVGLGIELGPQLFNFLGKGGGSVVNNLSQVVVNAVSAESSSQYAQNAVYHPDNNSNLAGGDDDGDEISAASLHLGNNPTVEQIADGLWHMNTNNYITGKEISKIRPEFKKASQAINKVIRTPQGLKLDLTFMARVLLSAVPKAPDIEDGSTIILTRTNLGNNSVLHVLSPPNKVYWGGEKVPLDLYINNNGWTIQSAYPKVRGIFPGGTW